MLSAPGAAHITRRPFREKPLARAKPTVSTADQLFRHHKHEVKPPNRRNMSGICGKLQCGILETAGICGYSRFGTQERYETPSIFRAIFRNTKFSNTSYIPKDIPEYLGKAKTDGPKSILFMSRRNTVPRRPPPQRIPPQVGPPYREPEHSSVRLILPFRLHRRRQAWKKDPTAAKGRNSMLRDRMAVCSSRYVRTMSSHSQSGRVRVPEITLV